MNGLDQPISELLSLKNKALFWLSLDELFDMNKDTMGYLKTFFQQTGHLVKY